MNPSYLFLIINICVKIHHILKCRICLFWNFLMTLSQFLNNCISYKVSPPATTSSLTATLSLYKPIVQQNQIWDFTQKCFENLEKGLKMLTYFWKQNTWLEKLFLWLWWFEYISSFVCFYQKIKNKSYGILSVFLPSTWKLLSLDEFSYP